FRVPEEPDEYFLMHEEPVLASLVELSGVEILSAPHRVNLSPTKISLGVEVSGAVRSAPRRRSATAEKSGNSPERALLGRGLNR
ncbi:hypothetical protein ACWD8I_22170, partial [Micromonospora arida]